MNVLGTTPVDLRLFGASLARLRRDQRVVWRRAAAPVETAPLPLADYTPPAGWTLSATYDWRTMAPGLVGANALMAPWIINDTDNATSNYEATNVYTVDTPWGTALALRARATGTSDAERFGGKAEIPYASGPVGSFLFVVWSTIRPVHGKKTSLWSIGYPGTPRGHLEIDLCEMGWAQRGTRLDGYTPYDIDPGEGYVTPSFHLWDYPISDSVSPATAPQDNKASMYPKEKLEEPRQLAGMFDTAGDATRIWHDGVLVKELTRTDAVNYEDGVSDNGNAWGTVWDNAETKGNAIVLNAEAAKAAKTWGAEYGDREYGSGPFDPALFPSESWVHKVEVYVPV
jgi:hypothetical protein